MKRRIIYLFVTIIICLGIVFGHKIIGEKEYVQAEETKQANVLGSMSAKNTKSILTLDIDGKKIKNSGKLLFYIDDNHSLMVSSNLVTDYFNCAVNLYDDNKLVIERGDDRIEITEDSLTEKDGQVYLPAEILEKDLDYNLEWDYDNSIVRFENANPDKAVLPSYYNYQDNGRAPGIKDQGKWGTCWSFASLTAFESSLLPEESLDFSEDHMSLNNSFNISRNDGGDYTMSLAYLTAWQGPVYESQDPYGDGKTVDGLTAVKHLQEAQIIKSKDYEAIKEMIYKYGGVQSSLYTSMVNNYNSKSQYYNGSTSSYCYIGEQEPNHDIVIIGWDDNYPKENFNKEVEGNGAFICRNSWGSDFGDNGTFYVSYYDSDIGMHNIVYTDIEGPDNYDNIYQSDLCGWVGQLGYGKDTAYFANVYTSKGNEKLTAVSFYATGENTEYNIYVCKNFTDTKSLNILQKTSASGVLDNAGYYTVSLDDPVVLAPNEKYAIIIKVKTPGSTRPVAIEYVNDEKTANVDLTDGEGYISLRGFDWERTEEKHNCNICLKAFTDKIE
jgi:C1A family cysteine protease